VNRLEAALLEIALHLEERRIPYMVIGGFANLHWGKPRLTEDIDLKVEMDEGGWPSMVAGVSGRFRVLVEDPLAFLSETRVLPIATGSGVRADLVVAGLPYEREALGRAVSVPIAGKAVRICTAEDLIVQKIISDRQRDRDDVEGVIQRQGGALDRDMLDPLVQEMAAGLERPEILQFYRSCLRKAGLAAS
jgi:hypothetical protein